MSKKVLIVDDEEDTRSYLEALLSDNGYETALASPGARLGNASCSKQGWV